jgi:hypothetical protein
MCGLDSAGSVFGSMAEFCENGNEPSFSLKGGEFTEQFEQQKEDSSPRSS